MLNGIDAGVDCFGGRFVAMTMNGNFFAEPMGFVDQRRHFSRIELRNIDFVA